MVKEKSIYDELGEERKVLQDQGLLPDWVTTAAWQMLKQNYLSEKYPDLKTVYMRVAKHAASYMKTDAELWEEKFFNLFWKGWLAASTPVLSNMGTGFGCPVSCSGGVVGDHIYSFYDSQTEAAMLSKNGFGTSGYIGGIRPRGSKITGIKGSASGVLPVFKDFVQMSRDINQGSQRRGAWAGYIEIDHKDFYELVTYVGKNPDDANIGWNISNEFIKKLDAGDPDAISRYQKALKLKMVTGKGYFNFIDKVNEQNPQMYKDKGLTVKASNLCLSGDTRINIKGDISGELQVSMEGVNNYLGKNDDVENWRVWSYNIETNSGEWKRILRSSQTKRNAKLIKITDRETGKYIKCTPCHLVFTKNRGYIEAGNLVESDILVLK
ncbi:Intein N-terminal splicing region [uncultured Caudovirales phage]|uniref:Ribonucleoside-diphosphate reductase n=1 Tax=uncultured Caudovirales phage TaxID=2100421 RepID=A0A6J5L248_9CAUD|nr:Intein N-terminal splicing region [uncultured Caudovirales phage]